MGRLERVAAARGLGLGAALAVGLVLGALHALPLLPLQLLPRLAQLEIHPPPPPPRTRSDSTLVACLGSPPLSSALVVVGDDLPAAAGGGGGGNLWRASGVEGGRWRPELEEASGLVVEAASGVGEGKRNKT